MISKHTFVARRWTVLAGAVIVALMAGPASIATAQEHAAPRFDFKGAQPLPANYVELDPQQTLPATGKGPHEGVKLHGHWVIDVRNADGTLAQHRDFENSIQTYGQELLVALLAGYAVPSDYGIFLSTSNNGTAPCVALTGFQGCGIVRSTTTLPGSALCPNYTCALGLTYTASLSEYAGSPANSFTLAGSMTAANAGTITGVTVDYGTCPANLSGATALTSVPPSNCNSVQGSGGYRNLSAASITTVNVVASQIVQVTVTFTFS